MDEREVIERIEAVDRALASREMSAQASERVREVLVRRAAARQQLARMRWWPMLAFAAGAALMAVLLLGREPSRERVAVPIERDDSKAVAVERPEPEPAPILAPRCGEFEPGLVRLAAGDCVAVEGIEVSALIPATIERTGDRIALDEGEVLFEVESRPDHPLHVIAGAIDIEVVGTRFVVHQRAGVGWISMLEGRVRVREGEAEAVTLDRGQRLDWSTPEPASAMLDEAPDRRALVPEPVSSDEGLGALLEEVATLRRNGQFEAAVDRLRAADPKGWTERSRQLVSYEIGTLLERQLQDTASACEHWRTHQREFPGGRYEAIVDRSITRIGCLP